MHIQLDDLRIENRQLTSLIFDANKDILFRGRALDDEGDKICRRLSRFRIGEMVEVTAESNHNLREGVYTIIEITLPQREEAEESRVIYRFSGRLRPVY